MVWYSAQATHFNLSPNVEPQAESQIAITLICEPDLQATKMGDVNAVKCYSAHFIPAQEEQPRMKRCIM